MATHNNGRNIVSYPSLSNSLNTLPNATSMSNIPLHANMYSPYNQQSQAKLQKALSKNGSSSYPPQNPSASYSMMPPSSCDPAALTMRPKSK